jgi:hypothetical protein
MANKQNAIHGISLQIDQAASTAANNIKHQTNQATANAPNEFDRMPFMENKHGKIN